jgi:hypothetical protein
MNAVGNGASSLVMDCASILRAAGHKHRYVFLRTKISHVYGLCC